MRTSDGLLVLGANEGDLLPGDVVRKIPASATGGRWGVVVVSGVPGEGGRTHLHRGEPEAFFLLDGAVELIGATSRTPLSAGAFALVPPDTEHGLRVVGTGPARWLAIWPAALDGLHDELAAVDPVDLEGIAKVRARHGLEIGRDRRMEFEPPTGDRADA